MKYEQKLIEAIYEVMAETQWKDEGLEIIRNIPETVSNISLDKENGVIEFEDNDGIVTYEIRIRAIHCSRPSDTVFPTTPRSSKFYDEPNGANQ